MKQCISKSSHPSTTCICKQKKEERMSTKKEDSFFPHRITSDTHLPWAVKEGVPGFIPHYCMEASPGQCWSDGAGESRDSSYALNAGSDVLHISPCWWLLAKLRPKASLRVSLALQPCCCWEGAHLCTAGRGYHAKREEGTMHFLTEKRGEGGLSTASDMGFTTKTGVDIRNRYCLGPLALGVQVICI